MNKFIKSEEVYIKTSDWWDGNFLEDGSELGCWPAIDLNNPDAWSDQEYVQLGLYINEQQRLARVAVWGTDTFGMQKDFIYYEYAKAIKLYEKLKNKNNITIQLLKDEGFYIYS